MKKTVKPVKAPKKAAAMPMAKKGMKPMFGKKGMKPMPKGCK